MPRLVVPGLPHHVTQRGARRQPTFFRDGDYADYLRLLADACRQAGTGIWAYCLMPNHVHLVAVPERADSLARAFRVTHRDHSRRINERHEWRGHLWQERFHSFVMDERHLLMALRYIELNPVRAGLCARPEDWPWSSVHVHLGRRREALVSASPVQGQVRDWAAFLAAGLADGDLRVLRDHGRTGRPAGSADFVGQLERATGRRLRRSKPGPKRSTEISELSPN